MNWRYIQTTDSNSNDVSNQVLADPNLSDDYGLSDSNTNDVSNSVTDDNNDTSNDNADPTIYYTMEGTSSDV